MYKIFISYRRSDSITHTGRIYDKLVATFGKGFVFKDVDDIPPGADFRKVLREAVDQCRVLLVVIGPNWLHTKDERGNRRLDNASDFVRIEVAAGLGRADCVVIPLLVGGASMPPESELPAGLNELAFRNGQAVRDDPDFHRDMERLLAWLDKIQPVEAEKIEPVVMEKPKIPNIVPAAEVLQVLPAPFEWCEVPGGELVVEGRSYAVPPFYIGRTCVTRGQFQVFVDAPDGYCMKKWWDYSNAASAWRAKRAIPDENRNTADTLPRTRVSWYDSVAFCLWLSRKTGQKIRLPSEVEWQWAAAGQSDQLYAWGDEISPAVANYHHHDGVSHEKLPVDHFAGVNDSWVGAVDLGGNVWQWCVNDFSGLDLSDVGLSHRAKSPLRGGSFHDLPELLQVSHRSYVSPDHLSGDIGFRCVWIPE